MTQKQKDFLNELGALLDKYSIDSVRIIGDKMIAFESNNEVLSFSEFDGDTFNAVVSTTEMYTPNTY